MKGKKILPEILQRPYPRVPLHPMTIKYMKKGHPWVTLDKFSAQFPPKRTFLVGTNGKSVENSILIHDPDHKTVKARVWSQKEPFVEGVKHFPQDLNERVKDAFLKREQLKIERERDNFYLIFGESDYIPGVHVQKFKQTILVQYYANYWEKLQNFLLRSIELALKEFYPGEKFSLVIQQRNSDKKANSKKAKFSEINCAPIKTEVIQEYGVRYQIYFDQSYDFGIYTDMAAIRKRVAPYLKGKNKLLNLYSYTGAYSLFALSQGVEKTVSVDLSGKYLSWLDKNIELNEDFKNRNTNIESSTEDALSRFKQSDEKFDFIVCDPPSASSDGKKVTKAFNAYSSLLPKLVEITEKDGNILIFLNTHSITWKKFETKIQEILKTRLKNKKVTIEKKFNLIDDCPRLSGFIEGDYLKGLLLKVH